MMKRTTKVNTLASEDRAEAQYPDTSNSPAAKAKPDYDDKAVVYDDRLMPYSRARSLSWADERRLVRNHVGEALKPQDILGDQACDLIADQITHIRMLERFRALILERARGEAITNLLIGRIENAHGHVLAMLKGDEAARRIVEEALAAFGIPEEAIEAEAFMIAIDEIERLSRLSAQAQIRLDLQLRQIERRRPMIAHEIKALVHADIDAQEQDEDHSEFAPDLPKPDQDRDKDQEELDRLAREEDEEEIR